MRLDGSILAELVVVTVKSRINKALLCRTRGKGIRNIKVVKESGMLLLNAGARCGGHIVRFNANALREDHKVDHVLEEAALNVGVRGVADEVILFLSVVYTVVKTRYPREGIINIGGKTKRNDCEKK